MQSMGSTLFYSDMGTRKEERPYAVHILFGMA